MILGLVGGAVGIISFGFSKSLIWATLSRAICGLFNGMMEHAKGDTLCAER